MEPGDLTGNSVVFQVPRSLEFCVLALDVIGDILETRTTGGQVDTRGLECTAEAKFRPREVVLLKKKPQGPDIWSPMDLHTQDNSMLNYESMKHTRDMLLRKRVVNSE